MVGGNTGASSSESLAFRSRKQHQARSASESAGSSSVTAGVQKSSGAAKRRLGGTRTIKKIISGWWARTPPEMALVVPPPIDKKRVKVYELRNNDWFDRGTGFCTGRVIGVRYTLFRSSTNGARAVLREILDHTLTSTSLGGFEDFCRVRGPTRSYAARDPDNERRWLSKTTRCAP